ncbi:DoxX-like family protein [Roseovarius phycicola]|uniref:DoxX-like family protein n=1 Tax=Roseovarius phycicola TaxID=3080976 RepID=A0ABZ2HGL9_9RHOB
MTDAYGKVLVLGADGFIGRHLAFGLRDAGWDVLASARHPERLARMGFNTLKADLTSAEAQTQDYWSRKLEDVTHVVNAAGVLHASDATYKAVHVDAPNALYAAMKTTRGILISAVGIDEADTAFARYRRGGEQAAEAHGITILRAGLVLADTSYGGSSLARSLAALPFVTPVVGNGTQTFNPVHASDLSLAVDHMLRTPPGPERHEIGGPETVTQRDMIAAMRRWLGLRPTLILPLPMALARMIGRLGDAMQWGPISATSVAQLNSGVVAQPDAAIANMPDTPRGFSQFLFARPAGTQDLWHARLYLFRPLVRVVLGVLWLASGILGLILPSESFLPLVQNATLPDGLLIALARLGGLVDLAIAAALFRGWRPKLVACLQAAMVLSYTVAFTALAPVLWLLPLGGLLKNLPILALIAIMAILEDER